MESTIRLQITWASDSKVIGRHVEETVVTENLRGGFFRSEDFLGRVLPIRAALYRGVEFRDGRPWRANGAGFQNPPPSPQSALDYEGLAARGHADRNPALRVDRVMAPDPEQISEQPYVAKFGLDAWNHSEIYPWNQQHADFSILASTYLLSGDPSVREVLLNHLEVGALMSYSGFGSVDPIGTPRNARLWRSLLRLAQIFPDEPSSVDIKDRVRSRISALVHTFSVRRAQSGVPFVGETPIFEEGARTPFCDNGVNGVALISMGAFSIPGLPYPANCANYGTNGHSANGNRVFFSWQLGLLAQILTKGWDEFRWPEALAAIHELGDAVSRLVDNQGRNYTHINVDNPLQDSHVALGYAASWQSGFLRAMKIVIETNPSHPSREFIENRVLNHARTSIFPQSLPWMNSAWAWYPGSL